MTNVMKNKANKVFTRVFYTVCNVYEDFEAKNIACERNHESPL